MEIKTPTRNIGIDLLRICSMLMVVILHILIQGGVLSASAQNELNGNIALFMRSAVYCAVNCYALISGYVGISAKHRPANLATLWMQVAFYAVGITVLMHFILVPADIRLLFKAVLPVTGEMYWYFTSYFAMWFFVPFMNSAIDNLPKTKAGVYLVVSGLILLPISIYKDRFFLNLGYSAVWLAYMYLIGAYMSKHKLFIGVSSIKSLLAYLFCSSIAAVYSIFLPSLEAQDITLMNYVSPFNVVAAISLLVFFINLKIPDKFSKIITSVSSVSFGVYLIHTHPIIYSEILHNKFIFLADKSPFLMIIGVIGCSIGIFVVCALIDYLRLLLFKVLKIRQICTAVLDFVKKSAETIFKKLSRSSNI